MLQIVDVACPGSQTPDAAGICQCPSGTTSGPNGACSASIVGAVVGGTVGGGLALIGLAVAAVLLMMRREDRSWRIPFQALRFSDPLEVRALISPSWLPPPLSGWQLIFCARSGICLLF